MKKVYKTKWNSVKIDLVKLVNRRPSGLKAFMSFGKTRVHKSQTLKIISFHFCLISLFLPIDSVLFGKTFCRLLRKFSLMLS